MRYIKVVLAAIALISSAAASSADGKCGGSYGSCPEGTCCSKFGYCGTTKDHCGAGCQSKYGYCLNTSKSSNKAAKKTTVKKTTTTTKKAAKAKTTTTKKAAKAKTTTTKKAAKAKTTTTKRAAKAKTTKVVVPTNNKKISTNGQCGEQYGACPGGQCCSQFGYCGISKDHCNFGCQSEYGLCGNEVVEKNTVVGFEYYDTCVNNKYWALTFDDGPYNYDIELLDLLKKRGVKATFFINGANVMDIKTEKAKKIIKRMDADGHIVASHTWSHSNIAEISKSELIKEMTNLEDYIYKYIGKKPAFMRPPYGAGQGNAEIGRTLKSLGYTAACMWGVDTKDWENKGDSKFALNEFKSKLGEPILSLNHNYYSDITKDKLLKLIDAEITYMKKQGYTPVTMDKCLGLKAYQ